MSSGPGAAGAEGVPFKATGSGTNALATCPAGFTLCFTTSGSFSEPRLGAGTFTALTREQTTGACADGSGIAGTATATLTATVAGGTLKLLLDATFCAAADLIATLNGTFTVTGATGRLAGASGSGSFSGKASLVSEQLTLTGRLEGVTERLTISRSGLGSVRSSPAGISCPGTCEAEFVRGTEVTLTAHPASGVAFGRWSGTPSVCSDPAATSCKLTLSASRTVHASFTDRTPKLRVSRQGPGFVTSSPAGISCPGTCEAQFKRATKVVLTAKPAANAVFRRFADQPACAASQPTCTLTLYDDARVSAVFEYSFPERTLKVSRTGLGAVRSEPAGISCPPACEARFKERTDVRLTASPASGHRFSGWGGRCAASGASFTCRLTISGDMPVSASFGAVPKPVRTLKVSRSGEGFVRSEPAGISCPPTCETRFKERTDVRLIASPAADYRFSGWRGKCAASGTSSTCRLTISGDTLAGADFTAVPKERLEVKVVGEGSVTSEPRGISCSLGTCTALFRRYTLVTLTATARSGWKFDGWKAGAPCAGTAATVCKVTLDRLRAVTARFVRP